MNVFVTGGSGFLGQRVIKKLTEDKHSIFALSRSTKSNEIVQSLGATPVIGNLNQISKFKNELMKMDVIVHCAAPVEFWGPWGKYEAGIIKATQLLAEAAEECGVKRFIHISSESVLQDTSSLLDIDESYAYPIEPNSYYGKAKKIAEEYLLESKLNLEIIIIRPTFIWGPGSNAFSTIASKVKSGEFVWIDKGNVSFEAVHVDNVAEAVRLALTNGEDRGVYFITDDEESTVRDFFSSIFEALKIEPPTKSLPGVLVKPIANSLEYIWKLLRIKTAPPLSKFDLAFVNMPRRYNISSAKNALNYKPIISRKDGFMNLEVR